MSNDLDCFLYIDESGTSENPMDTNGNRVLRRTLVFCLGGLIVTRKQRDFFKDEHHRLIKTYFSNVTLSSNFKLHYYDLRMCKSPYKEIGSRNRKKLEQDIFSTIKKSGAKLLSFTIDLEDHYKQYPTPFDPLGYGLLCMLERFVNYMNNFQIKKARIIYERFDRHMRNRVYRTSKAMKNTRLSTRIDLDKLSGYINEGDPRIETTLQFADFWAYLPFNEECRWLQVYEFRSHYYNYDAPINAGNIKIRYGP